MKRKTKQILAVSMFAAALMIGCADDEGDSVDLVCEEGTFYDGSECAPAEEVDACGPFGHAHGEECHCEAGAELIEYEGTSYCVKEPGEEGDDDDHNSACGEHGLEIDGECDCDENYVFDGETCVSIDDVAECGPFGHEHDGECHCDDGAEEHQHGDKTLCVESHDHDHDEETDDDEHEEP